MRVVLSNWAWIPKSDLTTSQTARIRDDLTVYPRKVGEYPGDDPAPIHLYVETPTALGVAREYYLSNRSSAHEVDVRVTMGASRGEFDLEFAGDLREEQESARYEVVTRLTRGAYGGVLRASPGWGKSVMYGTLVTLGDTGERVTIESLIGQEPLITSLHVDGTIRAARASKVWIEGEKECYRLTLASGQWLEASYDHPVLTQHGYMALEELAVGREVLVAAPRTSPEPTKPYVMSDSEVITAGLYLADGSGLAHDRSVYCKGNPELVALFEEHVSAVPGFKGFGEKRFDRGAWYVYPHGVLPWIRRHGLDEGSKSKTIPGKLFGLARKQLALLIRAIWTDGNLYFGTPRKLEIALASEAMIDGLQEMLRRFGVVARKSFVLKKIKSEGKTYDAWRLQITDKENLLLFAERVGVPFGMEAGFTKLLYELQSATTNTNWDVVPVGNAELREIRKECKHLTSVAWQKLAAGGSMRWMSRARFERLVEVTGYSGKYAHYAKQDVVWEAVQSLDKIGVHKVLDITVPETGNVIANGMVVHNTVWTCGVVASLKVPTLVVLHKEFLADQWEQRIAQFLPGARVGRVQGDVLDFEGKHIVIGMVHTLAAHDLPKEFVDWPGLVVTDECFPAGTPVHTPKGLAGIEDIEEGDFVYSAAGEDTVEAKSERLVAISDLVLVGFSSGSKVVCTKDHPFLTPSGWVKASGLAGKAVLTYAGCIDTMSLHGFTASDSGDVRAVRETEICSPGAQVLLQRVYWGGEAAEGAVASVRVVWGESGEEEAKQLLFPLLSAELAESAAIFQIGKYLGSGDGVSSSASGDKAGCLDSYVCEESYEGSANASEGQSGAEGVGTSSSGTGRQRETHAGTSTPVVGGSRGWVEGGIQDGDRRAEGESGEVAKSLQIGSSRACFEGGYRGRWIKPQLGEGPSSGSEERRVVASLRVESVAVPESEDLVRLGYLLEGDRVRVYNLSVRSHPSYVVGPGVVVHNCHRISAQTWSPVPAKFPARWRLGLTATPRRKDRAENVFWYQIGPILYDASEQRMKPKVRRVYTDFRVVKTASFNPALAPRALLVRFLVSSVPRNRSIAEQVILALKADRKILVLSERLKHLDSLEIAITEACKTHKRAVPTFGRYVGGRSKAQLAEAAKAQIILATSQYAQEGLDIPALDTLFLTTPLSDVEQAVGRILRPCAGKKEPIVVDFHDDHVLMFKRMADYREATYVKLCR